MKPDRPMPSNPQAERAVLGSMLISSEVWDVVREILEPDDFGSPAHAAIYRAVRDLGGTGVDLVLLRNYLRDREQLDVAGGYAYLAGLVDDIPDVANAPRYAAVVLEKSRLRYLIRETHRLQEAAYRGEKCDELAGDLIDKLSTIRAETTPAATTGRGLIFESIRAFETRSSSGRWITGIPSGIRSLDGTTFGFQRGILSVIGARPSVGKTALALEIALHAVRTGHRCLFVSIDMPQRLLGDRILVRESGVQSFKVRTGQGLDRNEYDAIIRASIEAGTGLGDRLLVSDRIRDAKHIVGEIARHAKRDPIDLVIVDYVQLVTGGKGDSRYQEIGDVSRRLAAAANEFGCAIVPLAQLSRSAVATDRPRMAHLRESGDLEQDARTVILLDSPHRRNPDDLNIRKCQLWAYVEKNSEGASFADVELHFDLDSQVIADGSCHPGCPYFTVSYPRAVQ